MATQTLKDFSTDELVAELKARGYHAAPDPIQDPEKLEKLIQVALDENPDISTTIDLGIYDITLSNADVLDILESDYEDPIERLYELMSDRCLDIEYAERRKLAEKLAACIEEDVDTKQDVDIDALEDCLSEIVTVDYPTESALDTEVYATMLLDTGNGGADFTADSELWRGYDVNSGKPLPEEAGSVWLAHQQGYTENADIIQILAQPDTVEADSFLQSMTNELANMTSHMSALCFLVKMKLRDMIEIRRVMKRLEGEKGWHDPRTDPDVGTLTLDKSVMCGLFDPWNGAGSLLDVVLEKDVVIPLKNIWRLYPDRKPPKHLSYGSVSDVYGLCLSAWRPALTALKPEVDASC